MSAPRPLQRILGTPTAVFVGIGVAVGSGVFRTPGDVAGELHTPLMILLAWAFGGLFMLMAAMVSAELATRFPQAGGEYVYLREAYGDFVAFFFGWAYTIFVIGGGAATIAAALGDFGCELFKLDGSWSGPMAASAIALTTTINAMGLRTSATAQNILTAAKLLTLIAVIAIGFAVGSETLSFTTVPEAAHGWSILPIFAAGALPALWAYSGTTDSAKLAEEIKDVRRALPRALIGSTAALTAVYLLFNVALMRIVPPEEMAGLAFVPGEAMSRVFGPTGRTAMLAVAMLVCLGSLSSTVLATIRVTFALARDGLTFRFMARMSPSQAPVNALIVVGGVAMILVLNRGFRDVLRIYFFASAVLFGLSYATLFIFRSREKRCPDHVFRCPAGRLQAGFLILIELGLAINIAISQPRDAMYMAVVFVALAALYGIWKRFSQTG